MSECKNDGQPSMPTREEFEVGLRLARESLNRSLQSLTKACVSLHGFASFAEFLAQGSVVFPGQSPELDALLVKAQDLAEEMRKHNLTHLGQLQLR